MCEWVCVISHMGHWADGSEPRRDKKGGREGQNEIQKVWERWRGGRDGAEQTVRECDVSKNERVNRNQCHFVRLWEKSHMTAAANSQIQGEAVFIVFKVFVKMWIIAEDKVRLYSWWGEGWRQKGGDRERERLNTSLRQPPNWSHYCVTSW